MRKSKLFFSFFSSKKSKTFPKTAKIPKPFPCRSMRIKKNIHPCTAPVNASNSMFQTTQPQGSGFMGGMQIPANFGLGGHNLQQQQPQQQQQPSLLQGQHFASAQPQPAAAFAALNNPFLGMDSTTNNVSYSDQIDNQCVLYTARVIPKTKSRNLLSDIAILFNEN